MKKILFCMALALAFVPVADADVWKWVDADGKTHFVDTNTPIYTWTDESGDIHYSDTPDHEDAIAVQLVWYAKGSLEDIDESEDAALASETAEERHQREQAEAYYCKRATEIYESYVNAPRLYRTNEQGEREYLSADDAAKKIAETRTKKDDLCG